MHSKPDATVPTCLTHTVCVPRGLLPVQVQLLNAIDQSGLTAQSVATFRITGPSSQRKRVVEVRPFPSMHGPLAVGVQDTARMHGTHIACHLRRTTVTVLKVVRCPNESLESVCIEPDPHCTCGLVHRHQVN